MRTLWCWIVGHQDERIRAVGQAWVMPGVGPGFTMEPHPEGTWLGCRRCMRTRPMDVLDSLGYRILGWITGRSRKGSRANG